MEAHPIISVTLWYIQYPHIMIRYIVLFALTFSLTSAFSQDLKYARTMDSTSFKNITKQTIVIRQRTTPEKKVKQVYDLLDYKYIPFHQKKSVVVPVEIFKNDSS